MILYVALPIKLWAFVSMNKQGWLTRNAKSIGGEGQSEASLHTYVANVYADQVSSEAAKASAQMS
jgi:hyaluronan synthase